MPPQPHVITEIARADAHARLLAWLDDFLSRFTEGVPAAEIASWPTKAARARAYLASAPSTMIETEAALRGVMGEQMAQSIVSKADAYEAIIAATSGLRGVTQAAIDAADTPEAVDAALQGALAKAQALMVQMGLEP